MVYKYAAEYRPVGFATVPKGYLRVEPHSAWRHGVVVYDHPLTPEETDSYQLVPLVPLAKIVEEVVAPMREYAEAYLEEWEDDERWFETGIGQRLDKVRLYPDHGKPDLHEVTLLVVDALKKHIGRKTGGGKSRHAKTPRPPHGRRRSPRKQPMKPQSVARRRREYDANVREAGKMAAAASKPVSGETAKLLLQLGAALKD